MRRCLFCWDQAMSRSALRESRHAGAEHNTTIRDVEVAAVDHPLSFLMTILPRFRSLRAARLLAASRNWPSLLDRGVGTVPLLRSHRFDCGQLDKSRPTFLLGRQAA